MACSNISMYVPDLAYSNLAKYRYFLMIPTWFVKWEGGRGREARGLFEIYLNFFIDLQLPGIIFGMKSCCFPSQSYRIFKSRKFSNPENTYNYYIENKNSNWNNPKINSKIYLQQFWDGGSKLVSFSAVKFWFRPKKLELYTTWYIKAARLCF